MDSVAKASGSTGLYRVCLNIYLRSSIVKKASLLFVVILAANLYALDISSVLNNGQGDFDPWNQTRWAAWYSGGVIVETFDISIDVTFATRATDWRPELDSSIADSAIFMISAGQGCLIEGNGLVVDMRDAAYLNYTLLQAYQGGRSELEASTLGNHCFRFVQPEDTGIAQSTIIQNFTLRGFIQSIRTWRTQAHPLVVRNCYLTRNEWGVYLSGQNTTVTANDFIENGQGAMYSGSGSHDNNIVANTYRDNTFVGAESYGDIVMDTAYNTLVELNDFQPSQLSVTRFFSAVAMYRNMGENDSLREDAPHSNIIRYNNISGYPVGFHLAARNGRRTGNDLSLEGRDYCHDNYIWGNYFEDTTVAIKINYSYNTVGGNSFVNVEFPIVLHCVFYNLIETTINAQLPQDVYFWLTPSDYTSYAWMFPYHDDRGGHIDEAEKFIHLRTDYASGGFGYSGPATFVEQPSLVIGDAPAVADYDGNKYIDLVDYAVLLAASQNGRSDMVLPVTDGLIFRVDATSLDSTNISGEDYITNLYDQSGHNNHASQANSSYQPRLIAGATPNTCPAILFDGTDDYMLVGPDSSFESDALTGYVVFRPDVINNGRFYCVGYDDVSPYPGSQTNYGAWASMAGSSSSVGLTEGFRALGRDTYTTSGSVNFSAAHTGSYTVDTGQWFIGGNVWSTQAAGANLRAIILDQKGRRLTGTLDDINASLSGHLATLIGAASATSSFSPGTYYSGSIAAILIYNRALDSSEQTQVEQYLFDRYISSVYWENTLDTQYAKPLKLIEDAQPDISAFAEHWLEGCTLADVYSSGGTPIDIAVGDFYTNSSGDEIAVIWDQPVSEVSYNTTSDQYYTIIFYDSRGMEINRSGRSLNRWKAIASGDFINKKGYEVAAVSDVSVDGKYPVYIFARGREEPLVTLMADNTNEIRTLAGGNFLNTGDSYDEVAVTYEPGGPMQIDFVKPTDSTWTATTTGLNGRPWDIAGGFFHKVLGFRDGIATITDNPINGYYRISFFAVGATAPFTQVALDNTVRFTALAAAQFDSSLTVDQVCVAGAVENGVCQIAYYSAYQDSPYRYAEQSVISSAVTELDGGNLGFACIPGPYEKVTGISAFGYDAEVPTWGAQTVVLPQSTTGYSIPVYWLSNDPQNTANQYLKVTPLIR